MWPCLNFFKRSHDFVPEPLRLHPYLSLALILTINCNSLWISIISSPSNALELNKMGFGSLLATKR